MSIEETTPWERNARKADLIEALHRLRHERDEAQDDRDGWKEADEEHSAQLDEAWAEIERYREALERIANDTIPRIGHPASDIHNAWARDVLSSPNPTEGTE